VPVPFGDGEPDDVAGSASITGPPSPCARSTPSTTKSVYRIGSVWQAVRAPGSNVTEVADARGVASLDERVEPHPTAEGGPVARGRRTLAIPNVPASVPQELERPSGIVALVEQVHVRHARGLEHQHLLTCGAVEGEHGGIEVAAVELDEEDLDVAPLPHM
jgi:hypothetical protein